MFPYRDNLESGSWPLGVWTLVGLLALVNVPLFFAPDWHAQAISFGGFVPAMFTVHPWVSCHRLITSSALHADIFHLAGNCLFLIIFGRTLERLFGRRLLLLLFPALAIPGTLAQWSMGSEHMGACIGASGAIAAMMGAYLPLFPHARIRVLVFFGLFWRRFTVPAWMFLPYWFGLQLLSIAMGFQDGVGYAAHAGSFAAGLIGAVIWQTSCMGADDKLAKFKQGFL